MELAAVFVDSPIRAPIPRRNPCRRDARNFLFQMEQNSTAGFAARFSVRATLNVLACCEPAFTPAHAGCIGVTRQAMHSSNGMPTTSAAEVHANGTKFDGGVCVDLDRAPQGSTSFSDEQNGRDDGHGRSLLVVHGGLQEVLYVMRERGADRFGLSFGGRPPFCRIAVGSNAMPAIRAARPPATFCSKWNKIRGQPLR